MIQSCFDYSHGWRGVGNSAAGHRRGAPEGRPPARDAMYYRTLFRFRGALLHHLLAQTGIPNVRGVWICPEANGLPFIVVSLKQRYAGHARQAALLFSKFRKDIEILRRIPTSRLDPMIKDTENDELCNSRAIIDACRPYKWKDKFAIPVQFDPEIVKRVKSKWPALTP